MENVTFGHEVHLYAFLASVGAAAVVSLSDDAVDLLGGVQCRRRMCRSRFDLVENDSGQCLHWYGFSPVCVRMCLFSDEVHGNDR